MTDDIGSVDDNASATRSTRKIASLAGQQFVALTTYRKNGVGVTTAVSPIVRDGKLYFLTSSDAGKVKRLRNNPKVSLATSTMNGRLVGPPIAGIARRLEGNESSAVANEIRRAWGVPGFFIL